MTSYWRQATILVTVVMAGCVWMTSSSRDDMCEDGRTVIVHLFNWRWDDIATECEQFLGPKQFCGVQVSPPNEHINSTGRQWWERYQPVSYKIASRSGSKLDFEMMVRRCKKVGVRIFVDVVINHMASSANAADFGIDGNWFNPQAREFPEADDAEKLLYDSRDFNRCNGETGGSGDAPQCPTSSCTIENYQDAVQVRNCRLENLLDLATSLASVRIKISYKYLNPLIKIGVAGFRIDAAKHMNPEDIHRILRPIKLRPTVGREKWFDKDTPPYVYLEVIDKGGEPIKATDYFGISRARITEFKACDELAKVFRRKTQLQYLRNWGDQWGLLPSDRALVFVDNHDNQRGHGGAGFVLSHKEPREYKMASAFMLAHEYGFTRVMSSYQFADRDQGPPYLGNSIAPVVVVNGSCIGGWVCEHRWLPITNMVKFRNIARGETITHWWDNEGDQIAFCRGDRACIAFNNDPVHLMDKWIDTSLPAGVYCDIITGDLDLSKNTCTGRRIIVDTSSRAHINISPGVMDSMEAIHIDAREWRKTASPVGHVRFGGDFQRTVVFIRYEAETGQDVFIRGGTAMADGEENFSELCTENTPGQRYCPIQVVYSPTRSGHEHFDKFRTWADGDDRLDWEGVERYQRVFYGPRRLRAAGSPLVWSTNRTEHAGYQPENRWGDHYWMWDVLMDCSQTREGGWFEFKTFVTHRATNDGWEADIEEAGPCNGTGAGGQPMERLNKNHVARCGHVNQFVFNSDQCTIDDQSCDIRTTSDESHVTELPMDVSKEGVLMAGQHRCYDLTAHKFGTLQVTSQHNDTEVEVCVANTTDTCVFPMVNLTSDTVLCQLVASDWQLNITTDDHVCVWVGGATVGRLNDFAIVFVSVSSPLAPPFLLLLLSLAVTQLCGRGGRLLLTS